MGLALHDYLVDLHHRCSQLLKELSKIQTVPPEIEDYKEGIVGQLEKVGARISRLLADPAIKMPELAKNYLHDYKRLAEQVQYLEWSPVLAITRYSSQDRLATLMCRQIAQELNYPFAPPICVCLSSEHYWTRPNFNLIYVPALELFRLLGLPDLYHEIGHIILFRKRERILPPLVNTIDDYFAQEIRRISQEERPKGYEEELSVVKRMWKKEWVREFACDTFAAYLVGPAYGWANIRLCINVSDDLYAADPEEYHAHPADAARAEGIRLMLEKIGCGGAANHVQMAWDDFMSLVGQTRPQEFHRRYPSILLEAVRDAVFQHCVDLGLRPYTQQAARQGDLNVTILLNDGWQRFNTQPDSYWSWEADQIISIKTALGLQK